MMASNIEYLIAAKRQSALKRKVAVWSAGPDTSEDMVAEEVPVALVYNGISHAVMMTTPAELEAFALGFSLTEAIIDKPDDIYSIELIPQQQGIEVALEISSQCFMRLKNMRRSLVGRTGCGVCGAESLQQIFKPAKQTPSTDFKVSHRAIDLAVSRFSDYQPLQALTGAVHAAAWCDVGRHNALDKLIGALWQQAVFQQPGFLLISSRASYEMLQKAASVGIAVVAAVSAPTSLAVDIAQASGITLLGFCRDKRQVAYSHQYRLTD
ncbi:MAG: formate dehydrogenase accessory protein FdhD [Oceanicoccus sp.]|jgi:formate dehydrogenase accessory protein FdhD